MKSCKTAHVFTHLVNIRGAPPTPRGAGLGAGDEAAELPEPWPSRGRHSGTARTLGTAGTLPGARAGGREQGSVHRRAVREGRSGEQRHEEQRATAVGTGAEEPPRSRGGAAARWVEGGHAGAGAWALEELRVEQGEDLRLTVEFSVLLVTGGLEERLAGQARPEWKPQRMGGGDGTDMLSHRLGPRVLL